MESLYNAAALYTKKGSRNKRKLVPESKESDIVLFQREPLEEDTEKEVTDPSPSVSSSVQVKSAPVKEMDIVFVIEEEEKAREEQSIVMKEPSSSATALVIPANLDNEHLRDINEEPVFKKTKGYNRCEHGRQKSYCKECGGSRICPHNRQKATCKECGGSQICEHKRIKGRCRVLAFDSSLFI